jgi:two-component system chemotaxis response regulator CheB
MVRVLIVEDSPTHQQLLRHILLSDSRITILGIVNDGIEAVEFVQRERPDLILMDIHMPRMNGLDATRRIMESRPVPIIIVSSSTLSRDVDWTFEAVAAGALTFLDKPHGPDHPEFEIESRRLIQTIITMAEIKVVRRINRGARPDEAAAKPQDRPAGLQPVPGIKLIAIGASTGGPPALQKLLLALPHDLPVSIAIVQHITAGFLTGMIEWLTKTTGHAICAGSQGESGLPGKIYFAPDRLHMEIDGAGRFVLTDGAPEYGVKPAVARLFRSVAAVHGARAVGILLTGMGCDGAAELRAMRDRGAVTYAQDRESSVVHGMPGEAIRLQAAQYVLPPEKIAEHLAALLSSGRIQRN